MYLQRTVPSSFLGKTLTSHVSLAESTVMPWNRSSCPWNTLFEAMLSTAVIVLVKFLHTPWQINLELQL
jgi:hypothetical protein